MIASTVTNMDNLEMMVESLSSMKPGERFFVPCNTESLKAFLAGAMYKRLGKTALAVLATGEDCERFAGDLRFFIGDEDVAIYTSWEILPFEAQSPHPGVVESRLRVLHNLSHDKNAFIITTPAALMQKTVPAMVLWDYMETLGEGKEMERDRLLQRLTVMGYTRRSIVEEKGEISVRGGVVDIFPPAHARPIRVEFFGDEIERINYFDPSTQRSAESLKEVTIIPASEIILSEERREFALRRLKERADELNIHRGAREIIADKIREGRVCPGMESLLPLFYDHLETLYDYLPEDTIYIYDQECLIKEEIGRFSGEIVEMAGRLLSRHDFFVRPGDMYISQGELESVFSGRGGVYFGLLADSLNGHRVTRIEVGSESNLDVSQDIKRRKHENILLPLVDRIKGWGDMGWRVFLTATSSTHADRLKDLLDGYDLSVSEISGTPLVNESGAGRLTGRLTGPLRHTLPVRPFIVSGTLSSGFRLPWLRLAIITEDEMFGERIRRRERPSRKLDAFLTQLDDLKEGDYVVHLDNGIGKYRGLTRLKIEEIENDFLILEYEGGDKLYLPVYRLNLVNKYRGVDGRVPPLDKLGGTGWVRTKRKVKHAVEAVARELLELYAARKVVKGNAFSKPGRIFSEFEAAFEYDETPDQLGAIQDVLHDMQQPTVMDRLICGDVGYGKTEVAMRAAFKAVLDGKQVAVLVPTTVLAQQHYNTFKKRFEAYPVNIGSLSRFRGAREQREIASNLERGEIDIIIGTHRLLQKDIYFRDLGLVIIDEEHRFGVKHKERLRQLRKNVDVLTLTATPIPRTLHMSIAGIRDMSIISTPPQDRLSIKTVVSRFKEDLVRDAVLRELSRGGQVFFVHNRIQDMKEMAERLKAIVPEASIAMAHGQMQARDLERIMRAFIRKEIDLLLSTSIIESGLDIPSANTIIINRADQFGLADIYQLRGRVGRSRHRAYAYLLVPPDAVLSADARKRLEVLQELSELGAGFRIATYDMEIRGAGELVGHAQSGRIAEVGFDLYTRLLEETVKEMQGQEIKEEVEPEVNIKVNAYIPEEYIPDQGQRLTTYKRAASVSSYEELESFKEELLDRFGRPTESVENLLGIVAVKTSLKRLGAVELVQRANRIYIRFGRNVKVDVDHLLALVKGSQGRYSLTPDSRLIVGMDAYENPLLFSISVLQGLMEGRRQLAH